MSRLFPHPPYAEDQPLSRTILTTHVLYRGFQTGSTLGLLFATTTQPLLHLLLRRHPPSPVGAFWPQLQRATGLGAALGTAALAVGLGARMYGREEIEWRDRSWRLLENRGQVEVDDWGVVGTVMGVVGVGVRGRGSGGEGLGGWWRRVLGGAGMGSVAGVVGYMAWRYGIKGGRRDES